MKISISLPYPSDATTVADVDGYVEIAVAAERAEIDAVAATDHPFPYTEPGRAGHQALDPFVLFGYLAAATERLKLHFNLIVVPYRNPFLVARMVSTLDVLSHGRVMASVGAGYMRREFDALGAPFDARARQIDEGVAAMRAAWTGDPVHLEHERYRADGNVMRPRPVSAPHPPLWRGGNTRLAITSAVEGFDGWTPFEASTATSKDTETAAVSLDTLAPRLAFAREEIARTGRTDPLDVGLVRPRSKWLADPASAIEDLQRMRELGVTWVVTHVHGDSTAAQIESVQRLAALAAEAGVR